jgi:hypothetical protein
LSSPVCQTCLIDLYRKMTEHFRPELFDDSGICVLGVSNLTLSNIIFYWILVLFWQCGIFCLSMLVGYMVLNATFNNISLYRGGQFYWWRKPEDPEKIIDLPQVTDTFYHIMLYTSLFIYVLHNHKTAGKKLVFQKIV